MKEMQRRIINFVEDRGLTLSTQFDKLQEEHDEVIRPLHYAGEISDINRIGTTNSRLSESIAKECTDLAIVALGIIGLLGYDAEYMMNRTLQHMEDKYPAGDVRSLQQQGLTPQQAMDRVKQIWTMQNNLTNDGK